MTGGPWGTWAQQRAWGAGDGPLAIYGLSNVPLWLSGETYSSPDPGDADSVWTNLGNMGGTFVQSGVAGWHPARSAADDNWNGQDVVAFDGGDFLDWSGAAADWTFLHDGTPYRLIALARPAAATTTQTLVCTNTFVPAPMLGMRLFFDGDNQRMRGNIANASEQHVLDQTLGTGTSEIGERQLVSMLFNPALGDLAGQLSVNGGAPVTQAVGATPGTGDAPNGLRIGARTPSANNFLTGEIAALLCVVGSDIGNAAKFDALVRWAELRYGAMG